MRKPNIGAFLTTRFITFIHKLIELVMNSSDNSLTIVCYNNNNNNTTLINIQQWIFPHKSRFYFPIMNICLYWNFYLSLRANVYVLLLCFVRVSIYIGMVDKLPHCYNVEFPSSLGRFNSLSISFEISFLARLILQAWLLLFYYKCS